MNSSSIVARSLFILIFAAAFIWLTGCSVTREATLRDAKIKGAVNLPALFLAEKAESGNFRFSTHFNYTPADIITAQIEPEGYANKSLSGGNKNSQKLKLSKSSQINQTDYNGNANTQWETPKVNGGVDFEVFLWSSFAVTGSLNFAPGSTAGSAGIALQSVPNDFGVRVDAGILFNHFSYNVYSMVEERVESLFGSSSETYYFHDIGSANTNNFYISLTVNSANRENLVGGLLSLGYFRQTILDYNPGNLDEGYYILIPFPVVISNNTRLEATTGYFNILPAVFFNLNTNIRLIAGTRILVELEMGDNNVRFWPSMKMEFTF